MIKKVALAASILVLTACSTTPTGRTQFVFMPESQMVVMGVQAFHQMQDDTPVVNNRAVIKYVNCVAGAITDLPEVLAFSPDWEVVVFDNDMVNAFALPGGKIGVYEGLLKVAENQHQLAAVIGHEVGHVMARHGNERVSQNMAVGQSMALLEGWMASRNTKNRELAMTGLGLGAKFGVLMPFSRLHESEADQIGLALMAKAGFNPKQSVKLWQNMSKAGGKAPPEFLSTHPSHDTRIGDLNAGMKEVMVQYNEVRRSGIKRVCKMPGLQ